MRTKKNSVTTIAGIKSAVECICSSFVFARTASAIPTEIGAQLSMTGDATALGNSCVIDRERMAVVLRSMKFAKNMTSEDIDSYIDRRRFLLLCGNFDRAVAIIGASSELIKSGIEKIVVIADTPSERIRLAESLEILRGNIGITAYTPGEYDDGAKYALSASVYSFLASTKPEILIISRDCISKKTNVIRQIGNDGSSLTSLISKVKPVILTSSKKISSGRVIAGICKLLEPVLTLVFTEEVKNLRDAVIYEPNTACKTYELASSLPPPEQISF